MEHDASSLMKYQLFMKWYNLYLCWNDNLLSKQVPYGACPHWEDLLKQSTFTLRFKSLRERYD